MILIRAKPQPQLLVLYRTVNVSVNGAGSLRPFSSVHRSIQRHCFGEQAQLGFLGNLSSEVEEEGGNFELKAGCSGHVGLDHKRDLARTKEIELVMTWITQTKRG